MRAGAFVLGIGGMMVILVAIVVLPFAAVRAVGDYRRRCAREGKG